MLCFRSSKGAEKSVGSVFHSDTNSTRPVIHS